MARCEICDYCDNIGESTYTDFSANSDDQRYKEATSKVMERIKAGDGNPNEGVTKIWDQYVWIDGQGELCSRCRKEIDLTNYDNFLLYGGPADIHYASRKKERDKDSESGYTDTEMETEVISLEDFYKEEHYVEEETD